MCGVCGPGTTDRWAPIVSCAGLRSKVMRRRLVAGCAESSPTPGDRELVDLATQGPSVTIAGIMHRLGRVVLLLLTLGILCSGPVAACVCPDGGMPTMPCCPDQHPHGGDVGLGTSHSLAVACASTPAQLLPAVSLDLPIAVGIVSDISSPWTRGPPTSALASPQLAASAPPIYLATLRLRI